MSNQEILDNAPDWADTYRKLLDYPDCTTYANNAKDEQVLDRSLADIKRIVELEKERAVRDLEQQAKGIEVAVRINLISYSEPYIVKLMARAAELRSQAKALKEQE